MPEKYTVPPLNSLSLVLVPNNYGNTEFIWKSFKFHLNFMNSKTPRIFAPFSCWIAVNLSSSFCLQSWAKMCHSSHFLKFPSQGLQSFHLVFWAAALSNSFLKHFVSWILPFSPFCLVLLFSLTVFQKPYPFIYGAFATDQWIIQA